MFDFNWLTEYSDWFEFIKYIVHIFICKAYDFTQNKS